jgi:hypothetical protein
MSNKVARQTTARNRCCALSQQLEKTARNHSRVLLQYKDMMYAHHIIYLLANTNDKKDLHVPIY